MLNKPVSESAPVVQATRPKKRRIPVVTEDGRTQPVSSIRLPVEDWEKLDAYAASRGLSKNGAIREWIESL
jgi:hypothetical protein